MSSIVIAHCRSKLRINVSCARGSLGSLWILSRGGRSNPQHEMINTVEVLLLPATTLLLCEHCILWVRHLLIFLPMRGSSYERHTYIRKLKNSKAINIILFSYTIYRLKYEFWAMWHPLNHNIIEC
jgi:hypothetical protein